MMEGLTKYWGFYFVAAQDANGVGVPDFQDALYEVTKHQQWLSDLHDVSVLLRTVSTFGLPLGSSFKY
jgi:hypothetical protein